MTGEIVGTEKKLEENKMFKKLKDKKGFTLVELIVVLVILAILAALLVPALTGYIDKANEERIISYTRQIVVAAQTEASEAYGKGKTLDADTDLTTSTTPSLKDVGTLSELSEDGASWKNNITDVTIQCNASGKITTAAITIGAQTCTYDPDATNAEDMYKVTK